MRVANVRPSSHLAVVSPRPQVASDWPDDEQGPQFARDPRTWHVRCKRIRRNGERCRKWAVKFGTCCYSHGGTSPSHRVGQERRRLHTVASAAQVLEYYMQPFHEKAIQLMAARIVMQHALPRVRTSHEDAEVKPSPELAGLTDDELVAQALQELRTSSAA